MYFIFTRRTTTARFVTDAGAFITRRVPPVPVRLLCMATTTAFAEDDFEKRVAGKTAAQVIPTRQIE